MFLFYDVVFWARCYKVFMSKKTIDVRSASIRDFENFVFDHEVHSVGSDKVWYGQFDLIIEFDADHNARCLTKIMRNAKSLRSKYDRAKLEQGCWAMFGAGFDGNLNDLIWFSDIAIESKEALITSMFFMYRDLFALDPLEAACEMWWDGIAYEIHPMKSADPVNNLAHKCIQNAMFETLLDILQLESSDCQSAALHGLNHVRHPDTEKAVRNYIENHPGLTDAQVEYATLCANGLAL